MRTEWVFLDAFGTLITLDRVFERLQANLAALGHPLPLPDVEHATRREFAYYVTRSVTARDAASLQRLRLECAGVLLEGLRERGHALPLARAAMADALVSALQFRLYPDVLPALAALEAAPVRLGLISNWDCSLVEILARLGLRPRLEVLAISALHGCDKPAPALFAAALRRAGVPAEAALHVGDSLENDYLGARRAGMRALLLHRGDRERAPAGVPLIHDLRELTRFLAR